MPKYKSLLKIGLIAIISLCGGCSSDVKDDGNNYFHIESNDKDFDSFLNEYYLRHVRERDWACNELELGYGSLYMKEWESRSLVWMDTSPLSGDRLGTLKYYINDFPIDRFGYMWSTSYRLESTAQVRNVDVHNAFAQGWPIPNYLQSKGKNIGFEFNSSDGWTSNGETSMQESTLVSKMTTDTLYYLSPDIQVESFYAPFVAFDIRVVDLENYEIINNIEDVYFCWQTVEDGDNWFEVSQKEYSTIPEKDIGSFFGRRMFYPMYLHSNWKNKTIKKIKIEVRTTNHQPLKLKAQLNYVRLDFDTRQSNNNCLFLCYADEYFKYNNDVEFLKKEITKFRKMMNFLLNHLKGKDGLLDLSYFQGHDGIGYTDFNTPNPGHGVGNGYWDIYAAPTVNLDANTYFYKALLAMADLEQRAIDFNVDETKANASVTNEDMSGTVEYNETVESLRALAEQVKNNVQTKFWNEETGRFYYGDVEGRKIDYGYVQFNTEAITAGLATEDQKESIMSWLNGDRIVEGDDSTGEDIYFYEFAPRCTTKNNELDYSITWTELTIPFGKQCQNGGAIMYVSFYDLFSRTQTLGIDNSFERMKEINAWFNKVREAGGEGTSFYSDYYYYETDIELQGNGSIGAIGLDSEFLENAMVYDYISECILNLDASKSNTLKVSPTLPAKLEYLNVYNLYYDGIVYDLEIRNNDIKIKNVSGKIKDQKIELISTDGKEQKLSFRDLVN